MKQASALAHERGHASPRIVEAEVVENAKSRMFVLWLFSLRDLIDSGASSVVLFDTTEQLFVCL